MPRNVRIADPFGITNRPIEVVGVEARDQGWVEQVLDVFHRVRGGDVDGEVAARLDPAPPSAAFRPS